MPTKEELEYVRIKLFLDEEFRKNPENIRRWIHESDYALFA